MLPVSQKLRRHDRPCQSPEEPLPERNPTSAWNAARGTRPAPAWLTIGGRTAGEKTYKCLECGIGFSLSTNLLSHQRIHTGEKPACDMLNFPLHPPPHSLGQELGQSKPQQKPYKWSECGKSFCVSTNLAFHQRTHVGQKPYKCLVCGISFCSSTSLTYHQRIYMGEKPYKCLGSERSFRRSLGLNIHQRIHTGEKPYWCTVHGKSFRVSSNLFPLEDAHRGRSRCSVGRVSSGARTSAPIKEPTGWPPCECLAWVCLKKGPLEGFPQDTTPPPTSVPSNFFSGWAEKYSV
ncbi:zinc finger protein 239-like [Erythrolamprus reginae]|uniref:zinc finger protein 239-like n=1 Tax=Erythrolamprus reginae TaxID=121349 RepID=UPI00396CBC58